MCAGVPFLCVIFMQNLLSVHGVHGACVRGVHCGAAFTLYTYNVDITSTMCRRV
ncbi:hypothetical protein X777_06524 [Ooceraea biroi]|uniref:Uncharacterized protein n=1 Tax=Ooceraea biroi TaxID=2015173 RepID=A0A026WBU5_OOCBI|nr:hypothetical protein X777_06524 [Ooceraea biroi]